MRHSNSPARERQAGKEFTPLFLVPLDGSRIAEEALPVAARLARRSGGRLDLASVYEPLPFLRSPGEELDLELEQDRRTGLSEYLKWVANAVATTHGLEATWKVLEGPPAQTLAAYARARHINLVVMTTHGRSGVSRFWLGSIADQLIRRVSVPVLLLQPQHDAHAEFRNVVVALDGSPHGEQVLENAIELAALSPDVSYSLIHVVEPPIPVITRLAMHPVRLPQHWQEHQESRAKTYLESLAQRLDARGIPVSTQVLSGRGIGEQIQEAAHSKCADLIAVGTHGARGMERMLLGSVADKVIRGASQAVLVVPTACQGRPRAAADEEQAPHSVEGGLGALHGSFGVASV